MNGKYLVAMNFISRFLMSLWMRMKKMIPTLSSSPFSGNWLTFLLLLAYLLNRLSDESGKMEFSLVLEGNFQRSALESNDGGALLYCLSHLWCL